MPHSDNIWKDLTERIQSRYIPDFDGLNSSLDQLKEAISVENMLASPDVEFDISSPVIPAKMDRGIVSYDAFELQLPLTDKAYKPRKSELNNKDRELFNDAWRDQEFVTTFYGD